MKSWEILSKAISNYTVASPCHADRDLTSEYSVGSRAGTFSLRQKLAGIVHLLFVAEFDGTTNGFPVRFVKGTSSLTVPNEDDLYDVLYKRFGPDIGQKDVLLGRTVEQYGIALEDSKPIPGTDPQQYEPIEIELPATVKWDTRPNVVADIQAARQRVEKTLGWNPGGLDGCKIDSISPDSGDVLIISHPSHNLSQREAIIAAIQRVNIPVPCIVVPDEVIVESWSVDEIRQFRDRLNEVIYDKERAQ